MSAQEPIPSSGGARRPLRPKASASHPACPKCRRRMTVKLVAPVLFASNLDDVMFGCEECGTEAKRTVKRT